MARAPRSLKAAASWPMFMAQIYDRAKHGAACCAPTREEADLERGETEFGYGDG